MQKRDIHRISQILLNIVHTAEHSIYRKQEPAYRSNILEFAVLLEAQYKELAIYYNKVFMVKYSNSTLWTAFKCVKSGDWNENVT